MVQDHEEHLEHSPCPQDPAAGQEDISFKGHETGFDDVAGNDHIDAHIGETPFPRFIHNILFPQVQTNENQQEERQLEIPQSINIHGTASLGQFFHDPPGRHVIQSGRQQGMGQKQQPGTLAAQIPGLGLGGVGRQENGFGHILGVFSHFWS